MNKFVNFIYKLKYSHQISETKTEHAPLDDVGILETTLVRHLLPFPSGNSDLLKAVPCPTKPENTDCSRRAIAIKRCTNPT